MRVEKKQQKKLASLFSESGYWVQNYEPGLGSEFGIPDMFVMREPNLIYPIEIKKLNKKVMRLELFFESTEISLAQVKWHERFRDAGGVSYFCLADVDRDEFWIFNSNFVVKPGNLIIQSSYCHLIYGKERTIQMAMDRDRLFRK